MPTYHKRPTCIMSSCKICSWRVLIQKYGNKNLEWQRTVDKNIGVDLSVLNNRIRVTFDYYFKDTNLAGFHRDASFCRGDELVHEHGKANFQGWTGTLNYVFLRKKDLSCEA